MTDLKSQLIKLGTTHPELRPHIRKILGSAIDTHLEYFKEVEKNLAQELLDLILPSVKLAERPKIYQDGRRTEIELKIRSTKTGSIDSVTLKVLVTPQAALEIDVMTPSGKYLSFDTKDVYAYAGTLHLAAKAVTSKAKKPSNKSALTEGTAFESYFESLWPRMFKTMSAKNLLRRPTETSDLIGEGILNRETVLQYSHGTYEVYLALGQNYVKVSIIELMSANNPRRGDRDILYESGTFEECEGLIQRAQKTLSNISRQ